MTAKTHSPPNQVFPKSHTELKIPQAIFPLSVSESSPGGKPREWPTAQSRLGPGEQKGLGKNWFLRLLPASHMTPVT